MDQSTTIEAVRFFGRRLTEEAVRVSKLIVFGSHARGGATEESDIDVLVISEDFRGKDIFERATMICDPERETIKRFRVPLDVIMMTPDEFDSGDSLIAQAAKTGMVLLPESVEQGRRAGDCGRAQSDQSEILTAKLAKSARKHDSGKDSVDGA